MRDLDRIDALRLLRVMSETEYERTAILAQRAGLTMAAANRHLLNLPGCVEWRTGHVVSKRRHRSVPVYFWRRRPGAVEKVRAA